MKIENCHPKIEDRIDLRLFPQLIIVIIIIIIIMNHQVHEPRGHALVSSSRTAPWREELRSPSWHVGSRLHHGRDVDQESHHAGWQTVLLVLLTVRILPPGQHRAAPADIDRPTVWRHLSWGFFRYCPLFSFFFNHYLVQGVARGRTARPV